MEPKNIRELRLRLGDSQSRFGDRFQVSQVTVGYWENGRSRPAPQHMSLLANLAVDAPVTKPTSAPFRPIQYLGSKQRIAQTVSTALDELGSRKLRVGDLFSGAGVVSTVLGAKRPVTAVDVQCYSKVLAEGILRGSRDQFSALANEKFRQRHALVSSRIENLLAPLLAFEREAEAAALHGDPAQLVQLIEFGSIAAYGQRPSTGMPKKMVRLLKGAANAIDGSRLSHADLTATRYFGGSYFSYRQAISLDAIYMAAHAEPAESVDMKVAARAALLSTASEIVNTVGKQFAQPMSLRKPDGRIPQLLLQRTLRDRGFDAFKVFKNWAERWSANALGGNYKHHIVQRDVVEFVSNDTSCGAYYADPPYTIDHYSRFYHVLETLCLRDSPRLDEMKKGGRPAVMRGLYRTGRYQSPFCIPSEAPTAFERLFAATGGRRIPIVLSYSPFDENKGNRPRLLTLAELVSIARRHYKRVGVMDINDHSHRKLNARSLNTSIRNDAERLLICEASG